MCQKKEEKIMSRSHAFIYGISQNIGILRLEIQMQPVKKVFLSEKYFIIIATYFMFISLHICFKYMIIIKSNFFKNIGAKDFFAFNVTHEEVFLD